MQIPETEWRSLSHRERRALVNKERRRRKRKAAALKREEEQATLESQPGYLEKLAALEKEEEERMRKEEVQRQLEHEVWLERERVAQELFKKQREKEEQAQRDKEERERLIREEWEALQKREKEAEEKRLKVRQEKEERLQEALDTENRPAIKKPTHNPLAPDGYTAPDSKNFGTEKDSQNCPFFLKTGACRFGDSCSRRHPHPSSSSTLLIPGMYASLGLREGDMDERDDAALEYEEGDMYEHFRSFYEDVFPEFTKAGKVMQFKVSCNYESHLRGNVYVQYGNEEECKAAYQMFNGRWYAQRQLSCQFCPVQKWRNAICGLYSQKRCPKGKHCNFLHVFRNPGGAFCRADRDLPELSPPPSRRSSRHEGRRYSRSRSRSRERYHSRRRSHEGSGEREGRSRSRERRRRSRDDSSSRRHWSPSQHRRHSHSSYSHSSYSYSSYRTERRHKRRSDSQEREDSTGHVDSDIDISKGGALAEDEGEERGRDTHKKKKKKSDETRRHHKHKKHKHRREKGVKEDKKERMSQGKQGRETEEEELAEKEDRDEGGTRGGGSVNQNGVAGIEELMGRVENHTEVDVLTPHTSLSLTSSLDTGPVVNNTPSTTIEHDAVLPEDSSHLTATPFKKPPYSEPLRKSPYSEPHRKSPSPEPLQKSPSAEPPTTA